jgi:hypothetical protein
MSRKTLAVVALALVCAATGCARVSDRAATLDAPSASIPDVSSVAGHWQGVVSETAGSLVTGSSPIDLTIAPDGTWRGTIAKAPATGRARLRGDRLVLEGTAAGPDGPARPVYLDLTGNDTRRWGETVATFGGRDDRATVALRRAES